MQFIHLQTGSGKIMAFYQKFTDTWCKRCSTCPGNLFHETPRFLDKTKTTKFFAEKDQTKLCVLGFFRQNSPNCFLYARDKFCELTISLEKNIFRMILFGICANLIQVLQRIFFGRVIKTALYVSRVYFRVKKSLTKIHSVHFRNSSVKILAIRWLFSVVFTKL